MSVKGTLLIVDDNKNIVNSVKLLMNSLVELILQNIYNEKVAHIADI